MPRGSTSSPYSLAERRDVAARMFSRGYSNAEVSRELRVHVDTVGRYRREYEADLVTQARNNPQMLTDVLLNTMRALDELDQVRQEAWQQYEQATNEEGEPRHNIRQQYLKTILQSQEQRSKLFGLFGVKSEFFAHVQNVRAVQSKLIEFMQENLCAEDRAKLERFLTSDDVQTFMQQSQQLPELPA